MSKKFNINPPNWPKEYTFEEFKKLNPLINENQMIHLYNQYLAKFLNELSQQKIHFKQSLNKNLQLEINKFHKKYNQTLLDTELQYPNINFDNPRGHIKYYDEKRKDPKGGIIFGDPATMNGDERNSITDNTIILIATNGDIVVFTTDDIEINTPDEYIKEIEKLKKKINEDKRFVADIIRESDGKYKLRIQQFDFERDIVSGETSIGGTLESSSKVTYKDFVR